MKKRIMAGIMAFSMAVALSACGGGGSNQSASTNENTDTKAEETTESSASAETETSADSYNVGVIQLVQHPALDAATEGFVAALQAQFGDAVTVDVQNASGETANCATIANGFASSGVDLIMANATPALQAATAATGDIPIVGTSVTDYATALELSDWNGTTGSNVTGASDLAPLDGQALMLNELFPDAKNVGILYCNSEPNSKYQADVITPYLEDYGYTVTSFTFADSNDIASVVTNACSQVDVIYIPTDNKAADNTEIINNVALPAGVPIIAGEEGICSGCGVATLSISYYDMGYEAGLMAADILANGSDPSTMTVKQSSNVTKKYMADRAEELGVSIPDGYEAIETE